MNRFMVENASTLPVIPAKAGIQCLGNFLKSLDSSLTSPSAVESRWNDEQKNRLPGPSQTMLHARHSTGRDR
jgi:hypothetical protein